MLRALVNLTNHNGLEIGLTLHVSGIIVSGTLISFGTYLKSVAEFVRELRTPGSDVGAEAFAVAFDHLSDQYQAGIAEIDPGVSEDEDAEPGEESSEPYIHLRNAVVWAPGTQPTLPKTLWRGRLSHVSAWSIGTFGS